jgi:hypothetical protein
MLSNDTIAFMRRYALQGVADWRDDVPNTTKTRARDLLHNLLGESDYDATTTIESVLGGTKSAKFIPMPGEQPSGIEHSFFMPIRIDAARAAFDLLLLCPHEKCLGFRFEPGDSGDTTHSYGHIQMNRAMFGGDLKIEGLPAWVPKSYPAFPLRTSEPLEMFLSMATSIHGYRKRMLDLLLKIIPAPGDRLTYERLLDKAMT